MDIPNDIIQFVILEYNPMAFLSTSRRLNAAARATILSRIAQYGTYYAHEFIKSDPNTDTPNWNWYVFKEILAMVSEKDMIAMIYRYDAVNCLKTLIAAGIDVCDINFESIFTNRSLECLRQLIKREDRKFAMTAQVNALRFDDAEMLDIVYSAGRLAPTPNKLYCALIERRMSCYRYLLGRVIPSLETYEYLISQDLPQILDETLHHTNSWDFCTFNINNYDFHRFVGESANIPTLRVLLRRGFDPSLHNKLVIDAAAVNNMSAAIALSKYIDTRAKNK